MQTEERISCSYLESGFSFYSDRITACGVIHHGTGTPLLAPYCGGPLPLAEIAAKRAQIIQENQIGGHSACRSCLNLARRGWPAINTEIRWLGITHFNVCNVACDFCWLQWADNSPKRSSGKRIKNYEITSAVREMLGAGILSREATIDWGGGGEPTLMPEFEEVFQLFAEHGVTQWIHTNAVKIPGVIKSRKVDISAVHVLCSVDAGTRQTYLEVKKRDYFDQVWRNLAFYSEHCAQVITKYIVQDNNAGTRDIDDFLLYAKKAGVHVVQPDIDHRLPDPKQPIIEALAYLQFKAWEQQIPLQFGSTGANSAPEFDVKARVDAAFERLRETKRVTYSLGSTIDFTDGGNGGSFTEEGWGDAETWGTWTVGGTAKLKIRLSEGIKRALTLDVSARGFIHHLHPCVNVTISVNQRALATLELDSWEFALFQIELPEPDSAEREFTIAFDLRDITSPKNLGASSDSRLLGMGIRSLCLHESGTASGGAFRR